MRDDLGRFDFAADICIKNGVALGIALQAFDSVVASAIRTCSRRRAISASLIAGLVFDFGLSSMQASQRKSAYHNRGFAHANRPAAQAKSPALGRAFSNFG
jgi:hypothetical protein